MFYLSVQQKSATCLVKFATDFSSNAVQQQYVGEVGKSITFVLQINSLQMCAKYYRN